MDTKAIKNNKLLVMNATAGQRKRLASKILPFALVLSAALSVFPASSQAATPTAGGVTACQGGACTPIPAPVALGIIVVLLVDEQFQKGKCRMRGLKIYC